MGIHASNNQNACGPCGTGGGSTPGTEFEQNNKPAYYNFGDLPGEGPVTSVQVADYINAQVPAPLIVSEIHTPVYIIFFRLVDDVYKKFTCIFSYGKGAWGSEQGEKGEQTVFPSAFNQMQESLVYPGDNDGAANTVTFDLGVLPTGDYLTAANSADRDCSNPDYTYYFTYTQDGKPYLVKFVGVPDYYGGSYMNMFTADDLKLVASGTPTTIPPLDLVLGAGNQTDDPIIWKKNGVQLKRDENGEVYNKNGNSTEQAYEDPTAYTKAWWRSTGGTEYVAYEGFVTTQINIAIASTWKIQTNYNASGNTWPVAANTNPVVASIKKGFMWLVTTAGSLGGVAVAVNDTIVAMVDNPGQTAANWAIVEGNVVQATETLTGVSAIATQAEVNTGTEDKKIVTPKTLKIYTDATFVKSVTGNLVNVSDPKNPTISGAKEVIDYQNLFDKTTLIVGFQIDTSGNQISSGSSSCTGFIEILPSRNIFILRKWHTSPNSYSFYDINHTFISYATTDLLPPGGFLTVSPSNAVYIRFNISTSGQVPATNAATFSVYHGDFLTAYRPYYDYLSSINGKKLSQTINTDDAILLYDTKLDRGYSYIDPVNALPENSRLNSLTPVTDVNAGNWSIRIDRNTTATATADGLGVQVIAGGTMQNGGLYYQRFFNAADIGKTVWYEFDAKSISGSLAWGISANSTAGPSVNTFNIPANWKTFKGKVTIGSTYADNRLVFYQNGTAASTIEVKNFKIYFLEPNVPAYNTELNLAAMPNFQYKANQLLNGESVALVVGLFGDSWTQGVPSAINYVQDLSKILRAKYGNGGGGFYDFSASSGNQYMYSADADDATDTRAGAIVYKDQTTDCKGVNIAHAEFTNGSSLALNVLTAHQKFVIHYFGGATYGSFRYRIDGGTWTTVNTSLTTGHQTIDVAVADAVHTMDFEVTSGTCILFGVDMQRTTGIRIHKLGNRGLRAYDVPTVDQPTWQAAITSLGMDSATILLCTNDRSQSSPMATFKTNMETIIAGFRVTPYIDIAILSPSNNQNTASYSRFDYSLVMYKLALQNGYAYLDLTPLFGTGAQITAKGTFFDALHPTPSGGKLIANHLNRKLFTI